MATPGRLGDFEIGEEIGRGGFGVVYRARQISLDRPVAVKVLFRHLIHTQDQITRFEREARAAARLDHAAIVSVYAWGRDGDDFFIAQRLVGHGRTMADELTELRKLGAPPKGHFRRVAEVVVRVAEGLQQAHDRGIVHRDVKPSNILLDENSQPCLGDFGLAKMEGGLDLSHTGDFAGSPYFMSPEQADSKRGPVDHRSDIYSLGVTLYELLTLTQPFQGNTPHEILRRILGEEPRRPGRIESRVPADLETICLKAMEKNPQQRYPSALELAHDLGAFLDGEPISALPIGLTRRGLRSLRRHREPVAWGLLLAVLVVGGLWASTMVKSSSKKVDSAENAATIDRTHVVEIGQVQESYNAKIQQAAAEQDPAKVAQLVQQQQNFTSLINDNYAYVSKQLSALGDSDAAKQVVAGLVTGNLYGGLQSLQQVVVSRMAEQERDLVVSELNRRMGEMAQYLIGQRPESGALVDAAGAGGPEGAASRAASRAATVSPIRLVPVDGRFFLLFHGQPIALPAGWLGPKADAGDGARTTGELDGAGADVRSRLDADAGGSAGAEAPLRVGAVRAEPLGPTSSSAFPRLP